MRKSKLLWLAGAAAVAFGARRALQSRSLDWMRDQVILITGGSRGLGLLLAREAAAHGAKVAICARDEAELERAREELARSTEVLAARCDVAKEGEVAAFVDAAAARFGRIDVLINCASIIQIAPLQSLSAGDFREAMEINFFGTLYATLAALPHLKKQKGRVVNICSLGGAVSVPHLMPYSAAKFAAVGFSLGLAAESAADGVAVTTVLPTVMRTGSHINAQVKGQREKEADWFSLSASLPLISVSASRAARNILLAAGRKQRVLYVGTAARIAHLAQAIAPDATVFALSLISRLLPSAAGGAGQNQSAAPAGLYRTKIARSLLTILGDRASKKNNELPITP